MKERGQSILSLLCNTVVVFNVYVRKGCYLVPDKVRRMKVCRNIYRQLQCLRMCTSLAPFYFLSSRIKDRWNIVYQTIHLKTETF